MTEREFTSEEAFTEAVLRLARDYGWDPFHIRDQRSREAYPSVTSRGFPDFIMHRWVEQRQDVELLAAELKMDAAYSVVRLEQSRWLGAFEKYCPTFLWRPSDWVEIDQTLRDGPSTDTDRPIIRTSPRNIGETEENPRSDAYLGAVIADEVSEIAYLPGDKDANAPNRVHSTDLSRGELARLRRMNPAVPDPVVLRLMAHRNRLRKWLGNGEIERKWSLIFHGIALMTPSTGGRSAHSNTPIGRALFYGGDEERKTAFYSPARLNRLLNARGAMLDRLLPRVFRMMASSDQSFNWREMAAFVLSDSDVDGDDERAEQGRRNIASAYYRAESRAKVQNESEPTN